MRRIWQRFHSRPTSRQLHSVSHKQLWRDAASLIIASPVDNIRESRASLDYNVLFMKRVAKSSFPNSFVYPGGVLDKADTSNEWLEIFKTVDPKFYDYIRKEFFVNQLDSKRSPLFPGDENSLKQGNLPNEISFRICAIRESFEESGLLLLTDDIESRRISPNAIHGKSLTYLLSKDVTEQWRRKVHGDAFEFINLCKELKKVPDIWSLKEWCEWLTPLFPIKTMGKRFDTVFYACCLKELPSFHEYDKIETSESKWISPVDMIQMFMSEEAVLAPPQIVETLKMLNFQTFESFSTHINERAMKGMRRNMPYIYQAKDGKFIVLPGDDLYPEEVDELGINTTERKTLDLTLAEIMSSDCNKFRLPIEGDKTKIPMVQCNVKMDYGQVGPVIVKDGRIPATKL